MSNLCPIEVNNEPLTINLLANNGVRASAVFYLGKPDGVGGHSIIETHELVTGDSGHANVILTTPSSSILNYALAWEINACEMIKQADSGSVKIEIFQQGKKCKTISPTSYYGTFPNCSEGKQRNIKSQIIFIQGAAPQTSNLWESIS